MQRWWAIPMVTILGACEPMEPSGAPLQPVATAPAPASTSAAPAPTAAPGRQGDFDFEADARTDDDGAAGDIDPVALQAKLLGVPPEQIARLAPPTPPAPASPAAPSPAPTAAPMSGPPQLVWDPNQPLPDTSFGVRVLATLLDMQPPRAVLGLPDGSERVVQPGTFLDAERLIVLAVGRDAVQVAKVTPQGFYAKVETQTVRALYPNAAGAAQP